MKTRLSRIGTAASCVLFLVNCTSVPKTSVKDRWNNSIRNYALVPIYPLLEQVYIGDLRLFTRHTSPYGLSSRYIGHVVEIEVALKKKEGRLPIYPKTNVAPSSANKTTAWPQPTDPIILPGASMEPRLRMAAFPHMALTRVTEAELGGSGISGLWNWIVGGSTASVATLNLSVSGVETLEIDDVTAYTVTKEYLEEQAASQAFRDGLCAAAATLGDPSGTSSNIAVVTRAFYARGLKYVYGKTFGAALRAAAGEGVRPNLPKEEITRSALPTNSEAAKKTVHPAVDLSALATRTTPGLVGRFVTARGDTLTLEEVFERPMAFGVDVLVFPISHFVVDCGQTSTTVIDRKGSITLTAPPEEK